MSATPGMYVSPEQLMRDRAEYARKGIARGRTIVAVAWADGVVFVGENPSHMLNKTSEIYDRIAFAAVGKYNEFESMRVAGIRLADVKGYQYARQDVTAKSLATAYSQSLGAIFMGNGKPYEVELLIAQVDDPGEPVELFHILYDGSIVDERNAVAIGGDSESVNTRLRADWQPDMSLGDAVRLARHALTSDDAPSAAELEVSGLDRTRGRRLFFRLGEDQVAAVLDAPGQLPAESEADDTDATPAAAELDAPADTDTSTATDEGGDTTDEGGDATDDQS